MEDNKNNGYDDFFKNRNEEGGEEPRDERSARSDAETPEPQSKPSYYYSYGPFKPGSGQSQEGNGGFNAYGYRASAPGGDGGTGQNDGRSYESPAGGDLGAEEPEQTRPAEITPPPQLRAFTPSQSSQPKGGWQVREPRRRSSFRAMFASFLAGVVVVGGLMWASDNYNWFSQNRALSTNSGQTEQAQPVSSGGGSASAVAARPDDLSQLFNQASPAVVKITTYVNPANQQGSSLLDDPFFRQFFGDGYSDRQQDQGDGKLQESGIGTGFFFDSTGYILTNQHVIADSDKIEVTVQGYDQPFTAELLGSDRDLDLAVVKITGNKAFPTLKLGSSDDIKIGDWVVAIGNPYGFDHTITAGVLSAKERPISISDTEGTRNYEHLLQTDASINPGNSGGSLLNTEGEVIGMNTAVSSQAQGIGFAIPTSTINEVLDNLKNNKAIPKDPVPFIGATLTDVNDQITGQLGMDKAEGSIVTEVTYNSPAYHADLRQYDVILGIDGKTYGNTTELIAAIQKHKVGDKVKLNIVRNGKTMDLEVEIGDKNQFNVE